MFPTRAIRLSSLGESESSEREISKLSKQVQVGNARRIINRCSELTSFLAPRRGFSKPRVSLAYTRNQDDAWRVSREHRDVVTSIVCTVHSLTLKFILEEMSHNAVNLDFVQRGD